MTDRDRCRRCGSHHECDCWPHAAIPDALLAELTRVTLVGEDNPYGSDPRNALVCWPDRCAGDRMRRLVCGLPEAEYLAMWRVNLCEDRWSLRAARGAMRVHLAAARGTSHVLVLLGAKVAGVLDDVAGVFVAPFTRATVRDVSVVALPHPSGLSRAWNAPGAFDLAKRVLREAVPGVPWGSAC